MKLPGRLRGKNCGAGFGLWVNSLTGKNATLQDGVKVIHRTDYNYDQVVNDIANTIYRFALLPNADIKKTLKILDFQGF
jgi:hypothetical protein